MAKQIGQGAPITLDALFTDGTGAAVDPSDPRVSILDTLGAVVVSLAVPTRVALGHWHYVFAVPVDATLGAWAADWFATINGSPVTDEDGFTVVTAGSISTGDTQGGITCAPWASHEDAAIGMLTYEIDPDLVDEAFQAAGDVLYELTGRRYPGVCHDFYRPQSQWRQVDGPPRWWPSTISFGYGTQYGWCSCHRGRETGCTTVHEVKLPGHPAIRDSIVVKIDGVVFNSWTLDDGRFLKRVDGQGWPCCQNLNLPDSEPGTFSIAHDFGLHPPRGGTRAAVLLGTSLFAEWHPDLAGKCKTPARATRVTRTGITVELGDPVAMIENGLTGIRSVDLWVASVLIGQKRRRAAVLVPGRHRSVRRVGQ